MTIGEYFILIVVGALLVFAGWLLGRFGRW
jgi:hypothetical protein